jgi:hypothetical protein
MAKPTRCDRVQGKTVANRFLISGARKDAGPHRRQTRARVRGRNLSEPDLGSALPGQDISDGASFFCPPKLTGSGSDKARYARCRVRPSHESVRCNQPRQPVEELTIFHNHGLRARTLSLERFLLIGGPIRFPRSSGGSVGSKCAERLMLRTRRALFCPSAALRSRVAEPLCMLSMGARAVGSAVGTPLEARKRKLDMSSQH